MIFLRMSLHCKLVPMQYREYEYGLLGYITKLSYNTGLYFNSGQNVLGHLLKLGAKTCFAK